MDPGILMESDMNEPITKEGFTAFSLLLVPLVQLLVVRLLSIP